MPCNIVKKRACMSAASIQCSSTTSLKGKLGRRTRRRNTLTFKQIDLLESQGCRTSRDEESDDDEPNPFLKKEEGEDVPAKEGSMRRGTEPASRSIESGSPAERYSNSGKRATKPALPTLKHRSARIAGTSCSTNYTAPDTSDEYESDSEDLTDLESESEASDSDTEDPNVPLVAVLRGQPLPKYLPPPAPSKSKVAPKHRLATSKTCAFQAVLRGQIAKPKHDPSEKIEWVWVAKKGMTPKKRVAETEGGEDQGLKIKQKKAKV